MIAPPLTLSEEMENVILHTETLFTSSIRQLIHRRDYMLLIKQLIS